MWICVCRPSFQTIVPRGMAGRAAADESDITESANLKHVKNNCKINISSHKDINWQRQAMSRGSGLRLVFCFWNGALVGFCMLCCLNPSLRRCFAARSRRQ